MTGKKRGGVPCWEMSTWAAEVCRDIKGVHGRELRIRKTHLHTFACHRLTDDALRLFAKALLFLIEPLLQFPDVFRWE